MEKNSTVCDLIVNNNVLSLSGDLTFATVSQLENKGRQLIAEQGFRIIDLGRVQQSDSAGLALLIDWLRTANQHQQQPLQFINIPPHMHAFARVNGVDAILFNA